jgi:hypothetical protein
MTSREKQPFARVGRSSTGPPIGLSISFCRIAAPERKAVLASELFGGQCRAEIGIILAHDPQNRRAHHYAVFRLLGRQRWRADPQRRHSKTPSTPPHLALAALQQPRRRIHRQTTTIDIPQNLETPQLPIAHAQRRNRRRPKKPERLTFLTGTALTLHVGRTRRPRSNRSSGKS